MRGKAWEKISAHRGFNQNIEYAKCAVCEHRHWAPKRHKFVKLVHQDGWPAFFDQFGNSKEAVISTVIWWVQASSHEKQREHEKRDCVKTALKPVHLNLCFHMILNCLVSLTMDLLAGLPLLVLLTIPAVYSFMGCSSKQLKFDRLVFYAHTFAMLDDWPA